MGKVKGFVTRSRWSGLDRFLLVLVVLALLWASLPSHLFLRAVALGIDGRRVTFARVVPLGEVFAYWGTELRSPLGECQAPAQARLTLYQDSEPVPGLPVEVRYDLDPLLLPCMPRDRPFILVQTHKVALFGVVPLRPATATWSCMADGTPCLRLK